MTSECVLITVDSFELDGLGIECVDSFKGLDWEKYNCLIFHSSIDSQLDIARELTTLGERVEKVIYINQNISPLYYCMFTGLDADIYDTEEYLSDSSVLSYLISDYKATGMTIQSPNQDLQTLAKAIASISSSDFENILKLVSNEFWLKTLSTAVDNVDTAVTKFSKSNIEFMDILSESSKLIVNLESGQQTTSRELEDLRQMLLKKERDFKEAQEKSREMEDQMKVIGDMGKKYMPNSPFIFSTYSVPVTVNRVLYIKGVGNCRYLNSFIGAYQHYLKMEKQYSSKVLLILPKLGCNLTRYQGISRLASESVELIDLSLSDAYVTYEPKKIVLDTFFNQPNTKIFIVIDLLFGDKLIEGHMVDTLFSASGVSDVQRFGLKPHNVILPLYGERENIVIPHIPKYPKANDHTKRTFYFDNGKKAFDKLDKLVIKDGR